MKKQKIQIFSDIHGEAYHDPKFIWKYVTPKAPIAVVAGDVHSKRYEDQLNEIATKFEHVVALYGNHEWYRRDISWRADARLLAHNVHVLNPGVVEINNIIFIGATLWTDFKNNDYFVMHSAKDCINDFRVIRSHDYTMPFTPTMASDKHYREKQYIKTMIEKYREYDDKKIVIATHFMPSYDLVHPKWKVNPGTDTLNWYFSAQCDDVLTMNGVKTWVFGHTHDYRDMKIHDVRCVANPLGYPGENTDFKQKVILV